MHDPEAGWRGHARSFSQGTMIASVEALDLIDRCTCILREIGDLDLTLRQDDSHTYCGVTQQ
jgi:hypothetical protein